MENLRLEDVVGMYTVLPQALHGGIIRVLQTQFSSCNRFTTEAVGAILSIFSLKVAEKLKLSCKSLFKQLA